MHAKITYDWTHQFFVRLLTILVLNQILTFFLQTYHQIDKYVSWKPDAFRLFWSNMNSYCFPPFSLVGHILSKVILDMSTEIIIIPCRTTQCWFPVLLSMLPESKSLISLPFDRASIHPLYLKQKLLADLVSGQPSAHMNCQKTLKSSSWPHGGQQH